MSQKRKETQETHSVNKKKKNLQEEDCNSELASNQKPEIKVEVEYDPLFENEADLTIRGSLEDIKLDIFDENVFVDALPKIKDLHCGKQNDISSSTNENKGSSPHQSVAVKKVIEKQREALKLFQAALMKFESVTKDLQEMVELDIIEAQTEADSRLQETEIIGTDKEVQISKENSSSSLAKSIRSKHNNNEEEFPTTSSSLEKSNFINDDLDAVEASQTQESGDKGLERIKDPNSKQDTASDTSSEGQANSDVERNSPLPSTSYDRNSPIPSTSYDRNSPLPSTSYDRNSPVPSTSYDIGVVATCQNRQGKGKIKDRNLKENASSDVSFYPNNEMGPHSSSSSKIKHDVSVLSSDGLETIYVIEDESSSLSNKEEDESTDVLNKSSSTYRPAGKIDEETYMMLTPEVIYQPIKKVGKQMKNENFGKDIPLDSMDPDIIASEDRMSDSQGVSVELCPISSCSTNSSGSTVFVNKNGILVNVSKDETTEQPGKKLKSGVNFNSLSTNIYDRNSTSCMDLKEVISSDVMGAVIMKKYEKDQDLDDKARSILTSLAINKMLQLSYQLKRSDFMNVARQIVKLFPTESLETYYIPSGRANKFARGKLADKYRNEKHRLKKFSGTPEANRSSIQHDTKDTNVSNSSIESKDIMQSILWLKHNVEPWEDVISKWKLTSSFRLPFLKSVKSHDTAFIEWPPYKHPKGHMLIAIDFNRMYPGKENALLNNWTRYLQCIKNTLEKKNLLNFSFDINDDVNENERDYQIINSLHHICRPYFVSNKKTKWRPTIIESQESMILRVGTCDEIEERIQTQLEKQGKIGGGMQPFVLAVEGTSTLTLESFYTYIDGARYKLPTLLAALDTCFKAIQVFHLEYPEPSRNTWMFIQKALYNINTPQDRQSPQVSTLIKEVCR